MLLNLVDSWVDPGSVAAAVNLAGLNIHGALHEVRHDAKCIMHTNIHEPHVAAMASMKCVFLPDLSQHAMICGSEGVKIHQYAPTTGPQQDQVVRKNVNFLLLLWETKHALCCLKIMEF